MAQLPMLLSSKLVLLLILILGLMGGKTLSYSDSNEDQQLRQALFLVKLLKSEYVKVLRENIELKKGSVSVEEDNSTCPTTVEDPSLGLTTHSYTLSDQQIDSTTPQSSRPPMSLVDSNFLTTSYPALQPLITPTHTGNKKQPSSFNGRRMMPGHSKKYNKLRRDYDDVFNNPHPAETKKPTTSTLQSNDESDTSDEKETADEKKASFIPAPDQEASTSPTTLSMPPKESPGRSSPKGLTTQKKDRIPKKKKNYGNGASSERPVKLFATIPSTTDTSTTDNSTTDTSTTHTSTTDNVMSQVASELMNELNGVKTEKPKVGFGKIHMRLQKTDTPQFMKSSIKVHLDGSSRYPVPLPENHAFCHTNPYSPLCRTFIG